MKSISIEEDAPHEHALRLRVDEEANRGDSSVRPQDSGEGDEDLFYSIPGVEESIAVGAHTEGRGRTHVVINSERTALHEET